VKCPAIAAEMGRTQESVKQKIKKLRKAGRIPGWSTQ
jgi:biotin operon repressor